MTDRLAEIVRDFPRTYTVTDLDKDGVEQTHEEPRYGVTVVDLGGHPDEVIEIIRERQGRMSVLSPTAANVGIRVYSFGAPDVLNAMEVTLREAGVDLYWKSFPVSPDVGLASWGETEVQLVIADVAEADSPWRRVLEEGCAWYCIEEETS